MHDKSDCMRGEHIWDLNYEKEVKSERWCMCCNHFFLSEEAEDDAANNSIEWPDKSNKSTSEHSINGLKKGKIIRRS